MEFSSHLYQQFDTILVLSQGHALYSGAGSMAPIRYFNGTNIAPSYPQGYNVADYLLEVASDPPVGLFDLSPHKHHSRGSSANAEVVEKERSSLLHHGGGKESPEGLASLKGRAANFHRVGPRERARYATTFLTQLQYLSGREWKILRRCDLFI